MNHPVATPTQSGNLKLKFLSNHYCFLFSFSSKVSQSAKATAKATHPGGIRLLKNRQI